MKRDPDTGEFKVNGRLGTMLAVLNQFAPIMRALVVAAMLAMFPWIIRIERHLEHPDAEEVVRREVPPKAVTDHLLRIDRDIDELRRDVKENGRSLARLESAVGILLKAD